MQNQSQKINGQKQNKKLEEAINIVNMLKCAPDKNKMLSVLINKNQRVANTMNLINSQYGGDPQKAFYAEANKMGINPDQIFSMLNK